jgi:hypothetical protein
MPLITMDTPSAEAYDLWAVLGTTSGTETAINECSAYFPLITWHENSVSNGTIRDIMDFIAEFGAPDSIYMGMAVGLCTPELDAQMDADVRYAFAEAIVRGKSLAHNRVPMNSPVAAGMSIPIDERGSRIGAAMLIAAFGTSLPAHIYVACLPVQEDLVEKIREYYPAWERHFET